MRRGGMRHPISIERSIRIGKTPAGEDITVWQVWRDNILCEIEVRRGKEQFDPQSKRRYSEEVYRFRTDYNEVEGLDTTMVIVDEDGQRYDIKAPLPDRQRESDAIIEATLQNSNIGKKALILELIDGTPEMHVGSAVDGFELNAAGGVTPYVFSVVAPTALPAGLSINAGTGQVTGSPTDVGTTAVVFRVTDAAGSTSDLPSLQLVVAA